MNDKASRTAAQSTTSRVRQVLGRTKGYLLLRLRIGLYTLTYRTALPPRWRRRLLGRFWEGKAAAIHAEWGSGRHDYGMLGDILRRYRPARLLDVGCGSGRLFPLYQSCGVKHVVGVDVSDTALIIARDILPTADLHCMDLTELSFPDDDFDFCVCNRVLQHIPPRDIREVIGRLSRICRVIYVNELTESDDVDEAFFMRRHDYRSLFAAVGMTSLETGSIDKQTFLVFGREPEHNLSDTSSQ